MNKSLYYTIILAFHGASKRTLLHLIKTFRSILEWLNPTPGFLSSAISAFHLFHSNRINSLWFGQELEQMFGSHIQTEMKIEMFTKTKMTKF